MEKTYYEAYIRLLKKELIPALGCTEPIAIALAGAKVREVLGTMPETMVICCSGNIIKNVKSVAVPNAGGRKGVEVAAALGAVGGNAQDELEVLEHVTDDHRAQVGAMLAQGKVTCQLIENVDNLYVVAKAYAGDHSAEVSIINRHTLIAKIVKDGEVLHDLGLDTDTPNTGEKVDLSVAKILEFATTVDVDDIKDVLEPQIQMNRAISDYGLSHPIGARVGQILLENNEKSVKTRAKACAAAGSDARMGGCSLPVVINSGSGNQGLTVSLPVLEYAKHFGADEDTCYRALAISNLISIHLKKNIGSLSAFCGAVTAACGTGAAITYLWGGDYQAVCNTITNTLANVGGIVCDGAKASCATKIASAVDAAIMAFDMTRSGSAFLPGDGIVQDDIEGTIRAVGHVGRVGMHSTDIEILHIMTGAVAV